MLYNSEIPVFSMGLVGDVSSLQFSDRQHHLDAQP
jgi:hypothetical protein